MNLHEGLMAKCSTKKFRNKTRKLNVVTIQPGVNRSDKPSRKRCYFNSSSNSTDLNWQDNSKFSNTEFSTFETSRTLNSSEADSKIILAITSGRGEATCEVGMAAINIARPALTLCQISDTQSYVNVLTKINIFNPVEILMPVKMASSRLAEKIKEQFPEVKISGVPRNSFNNTNGLQYVKKVCAKPWNSIVLIVQYKYYALTAVSALLSYIENNLYVFYAKESMKVDYQESEGYMIIDVCTADKLELVACALPDINPKYSSLFGVLNGCITRIGSRTLRATILQPPCSVPDIEARLDCVEELASNQERIALIQELLRQISNIDQLLTLATVLPEQAQNCSTRQLNYILLLNVLFEVLGPLGEIFDGSKLAFFIDLKDTVSCEQFCVLKGVVREIVHENARPAVGEKGTTERCFAIKSGINPILDMMRKKYSERIDEMKEYVKNLGTQHALDLKLENTTKKGYHMVLKLGKHQVRDFRLSSLPEEFIRVERLPTMVTMTTTEILTFAARLDDMMVEIIKISNIIIYNVLLEVQKSIGLFYKLCEAVAKLDMLQSLAQASSGSHRYVRPKFAEFTEVIDGRHPLLDYLCETEPTSNNIYASPEYNMNIITGPNGSGKSIFIRQIVLLQVMAQIGSFVPATSATFRVADRILARIYLEDDMHSGSSAFVLEMKEIQYFFTVMTRNTVIIIDELCRSTSVLEGTALAMAICEHLLGLSAFTFFTTHYTFITKLRDMYYNVKCWQLEAMEVMIGNHKKLKFTYNVKPGVTSLEEYAIHLARLCWPEDVIKDVEEILKYLKTKQLKGDVKKIDPRLRLKYDLESEFKILKYKRLLTLDVVREKLYKYQEDLGKLGTIIDWNDNTDLKQRIEGDVHSNYTFDEVIYPEVVYSDASSSRDLVFPNPKDSTPSNNVEIMLSPRDQFPEFHNRDNLEERHSETETGFPQRSTVGHEYIEVRDIAEVTFEMPQMKETPRFPDQFLEAAQDIIMSSQVIASSPRFENAQNLQQNVLPIYSNLHTKKNFVEDGHRHDASHDSYRSLDEQNIFPPVDTHLCVQDQQNSFSQKDPRLRKYTHSPMNSRQSFEEENMFSDHQNFQSSFQNVTQKSNQSFEQRNVFSPIGSHESLYSTTSLHYLQKSKQTRNIFEKEVPFSPSGFRRSFQQVVFSNDPAQRCQNIHGHPQKISKDYMSYEGNHQRQENSTEAFRNSFAGSQQHFNFSGIDNGSSEQKSYPDFASPSCSQVIQNYVNQAGPSSLAHEVFGKIDDNKFCNPPQDCNFLELREDASTTGFFRESNELKIAFRDGINLSGVGSQDANSFRMQIYSQEEITTFQINEMQEKISPGGTAKYSGNEERLIRSQIETNESRLNSQTNIRPEKTGRFREHEETTKRITTLTSTRDFTETNVFEISNIGLPIGGDTCIGPENNQSYEDQTIFKCPLNQLVSSFENLGMMKPKTPDMFAAPYSLNSKESVNSRSATKSGNCNDDEVVSPKLFKRIKTTHTHVSSKLDSTVSSINEAQFSLGLQHNVGKTSTPIVGSRKFAENICFKKPAIKKHVIEPSNKCGSYIQSDKNIHLFENSMTREANQEKEAEISPKPPQAVYQQNYKSAEVMNEETNDAIQFDEQKIVRKEKSQKSASILIEENNGIILKENTDLEMVNQDVSNFTSTPSDEVLHGKSMIVQAFVHQEDICVRLQETLSGTSSRNQNGCLPAVVQSFHETRKDSVSENNENHFLHEDANKKHQISNESSRIEHQAGYEQPIIYNSLEDKPHYWSKVSGSKSENSENDLKTSTQSISCLLQNSTEVSTTNHLQNSLSTECRVVDSHNVTESEISEAIEDIRSCSDWFEEEWEDCDDATNSQKSKSTYIGKSKRNTQKIDFFEEGRDECKIEFQQNTETIGENCLSSRDVKQVPSETSVTVGQNVSQRIDDCALSRTETGNNLKITSCGETTEGDITAVKQNVDGRSKIYPSSETNQSLPCEVEQSRRNDGFTSPKRDITDGHRTVSRDSQHYPAANQLMPRNIRETLFTTHDCDIRHQQITTFSENDCLAIISEPEHGNRYTSNDNVSISYSPDYQYLESRNQAESYDTLDASTFIVSSVEFDCITISSTNSQEQLDTKKSSECNHQNTLLEHNGDLKNFDGENSDHYRSNKHTGGERNCGFPEVFEIPWDEINAQMDQEINGEFVADISQSVEQARQDINFDPQHVQNSSNLSTIALNNKNSSNEAIYGDGTKSRSFPTSESNSKTDLPNEENSSDPGCSSSDYQDCLADETYPENESKAIKNYQSTSTECYESATEGQPITSDFKHEMTEENKRYTSIAENRSKVFSHPQEMYCNVIIEQNPSEHLPTDTTRCEKKQNVPHLLSNAETPEAIENTFKTFQNWSSKSKLKLREEKRKIDERNSSNTCEKQHFSGLKKAPPCKTRAKENATNVIKRLKDLFSNVHTVPSTANEASATKKQPTLTVSDSKQNTSSISSCLSVRTGSLDNCEKVSITTRQNNLVTNERVPKQIDATVKQIPSTVSGDAFGDGTYSSSTCKNTKVDLPAATRSCADFKQLPSTSRQDNLTIAETVPLQTGSATKHFVNQNSSSSSNISGQYMPMIRNMNLSSSAVMCDKSGSCKQSPTGNTDVNCSLVPTDSSDDLKQFPSTSRQTIELENTSLSSKGDLKHFSISSRNTSDEFKSNYTSTHNPRRNIELAKIKSSDLLKTSVFEDSSEIDITMESDAKRQKKFRPPLKAKVKPMNKMTKREIEKSFLDRDLKYLQTTGAESTEYCQEIINRPTAKQIKASKQVAHARKMASGDVLVYPIREGRKRRVQKFKPPLKQGPNKPFDVTIFSDENSDIYEKMIQGDQFSQKSMDASTFFMNMEVKRSSEQGKYKKDGSFWSSRS